MQCTISYSPCCNGTNAPFCRKYVLFGPFHLDIWTEKVESWQPLHESHKNYLSEGRSPVLMPTWGYYTKLSVMNWCIKNIEYWIFVLFLYLATPVFTKFCRNIKTKSMLEAFSTHFCYWFVFSLIKSVGSLYLRLTKRGHRFTRGKLGRRVLLNLCAHTLQFVESWFYMDNSRKGQVHTVCTLWVTFPPLSTASATRDKCPVCPRFQPERLRKWLEYILRRPN